MRSRPLTHHLVTRAIGVLLVSLIASVGCSGARPAQHRDAAAAEIPPTTADAWQRSLARHVRSGDDSRALRAARALETFGVRAADSLAYESIALARLGKQQQAVVVAKRLIAMAARSPSPATWQAVERLVAWLAGPGGRPVVAWRLLEPLRISGCHGPAGCDLHARLLVFQSTKSHQPSSKIASKHLLTTDLARRLAQARPPSHDHVATLWQAGIIRGFVDRRRWADVDVAIADALRLWPDAPSVWAAWMYAARRRRGPRYRQAWLSAVQTAKLSAAQLRLIAVMPEVEADALLAASVWRLVLATSDATAQDRIGYINLLVRSHRRAISTTHRDALKRLVSGFSAQIDARLVLIEALFVVGAPSEATGLLAGLADSPQVLALRAEERRRQGDMDAAQRLAERAVTEAKPAQRGAIARLLARLWRRPLPKVAAQWRAKAARYGGVDSLASVAARVAVALQRHTPKTKDAALLMTYADRLNRALKKDAPIRTDALRLRRALVVVLGRKGRRWRVAVRNCLAALSRSVDADAGTLLVLARLNYGARRHAAGLAVWRRAAARAQAAGRRLDEERFLRSLMQVAQSAALAKWLRTTGLRSVDDLQLSWQVARKLLFGRDKLMGRHWLANMLARTVGSGEIRERLPPLQRSRRALHTSRPTLGSSELLRIASRGAPDLILEYLPEMRRRALRTATSGVRVRIRLGIVAAAAHAALGHTKTADRLLRELAILGGLRSTDRRSLLNTAWRHGLCTTTLFLGETFAAQRDARTFKLAVRQGLTCAQRLGDTPAAYRIATQVERKQISLARQLSMARLLADNGFDRMAVHFFERKFRTARTRSSQSSYFAWAGALLSQGKINEAMATLRLGIKITNRRPRAWYNAVRLLEQYGYFEQATVLLQAGVQRHPKQVAMHVALVKNLLRLGRITPFYTALSNLIQHAPNQAIWQQVLNTAQAHGRMASLHVALSEQQGRDRELDKIRIKVAAFVGDKRVLLAALRRLRAKGPVLDRSVLAALQRVGVDELARVVGQDLLTTRGPSQRGRRAPPPGSALNMRAALAVRRDPSSRREAMSLARLRVGRALEPGDAARDAAAALADEGYVQQASALGTLALMTDQDDALQLCRQGKIVLAAGKPREAMKLWRRAVAGTLTAAARGRRNGRSYRSSSATPPAIECLVHAAESAHKPADLRRWLRSWRDAMPHMIVVWGWSIAQRLEVGDVTAAVRLLRRAEDRLRIWPEVLFGALARGIERRGGGKILLRSLLRDRPRPSAWWLAFCVGVGARHGQKDDPIVAKFRRDLRSLARTMPAARAWLALQWFELGDTQHGLKVLGDGPLDRAPPIMDDAKWHYRITRRSMAMAPPARAAMRRLTQPAPDDIDARAAAAALVAVSQGQALAKIATNPLLAPAKTITAATREAALPIATRWLRTAGRQGAIRLAHALTLQGHPRLAGAVLKLVPTRTGAHASQALQELQLRTIAAIGTDAELESAVERLMASRGLTRYFRRPERAIMLRRQLARLVAWGRPGAARKILSRQPVLRRAAAPLGLHDKAVSERPALIFQSIRGFSTSALTWLRTAKPAMLPAAERIAAVDLAFAAGDDDLAQRWSLAAATDHDTPWRAWLASARLAATHGRRRAALSLLKRAAADAPAGALACLRLRLGELATVQDCRAKRPLSSLSNADMIDLAHGVLASGSPQPRQALLVELSSASTSVRLRWLAALAAAHHAVPVDDQGNLAPSRAAQMARALVAATPAGEARTDLIGSGLDDLAAVGAPDIGVTALERTFKLHPKRSGSRNDLGYARLLAGQPAAAVLKLVAGDQVGYTGRPALALLDTIATALAQAGRPAAARQVQRWSLVSSPSSSRRSQLPLVRQAAFLADAGRFDDARVLALAALRRSQDNLALNAPSGDGTHASTYARSIGIRWRALAVLRRCLRRLPTAVTVTKKPTLRP